MKKDLQVLAEIYSQREITFDQGVVRFNGTQSAFDTKLDLWTVIPNTGSKNETTFSIKQPYTEQDVIDQALKKIEEFRLKQST